MNPRFRTFLTILLAFFSCPIFAQQLNIKDFGAVGDGKMLETNAIQKAVDRCAEHGGGTVYFPAGKYLIGTLVLKDNVVLFLDAGCELAGSTKLRDYKILYPKFLSFTDQNYTDKSLIYAEGVKNIGIQGKGTINGNGDNSAFQFGREKVTEYKMRPFIIRMINCSNVTIKDITLKNSAMWTQHYLACENLGISGITVDSKVNANNDGMDIDACKNVHISNCNISSGDDGIVLKSTAPKWCEQIVITNCIISSKTNAFKLGTESTGGYRNILLSNCFFYNTRLSGITLQAVDGGILEDVSISGVIMDNVSNGIFIRLGNRARPYRARQVGAPTGSSFLTDSLEHPGIGALRNVSISNIQAKGLDSIGCSIVGLVVKPIENIYLSDIKMSFKGGGTKALSSKKVEEKEKGYPEYVMFGAMPAYGFYLRHINNIHFSNMYLSYEKADYRPAIIAEDVKGLTYKETNLQTEPGQKDIVVRN